MSRENFERSSNKKIVNRYPKRKQIKNELMDCLFNNPVFDGYEVFFTIRSGEITGFWNGRKIFNIWSKNEKVAYKPLTKGGVKTETIIFDNLEEIKKRIVFDILAFKKYNKKDEDEMHFQHYLLMHINEIDELVEAYGKIQIIDLEFDIRTKQNNKKDSILNHGNGIGKVDILATSSKKNCILYIEVKFNEDVIQKTNGMNKHFFDIYDSYFYVDMNKYIQSQSDIFNRNFDLIDDRKVEFITICGYFSNQKESTIEAISQLMSDKSVRNLIDKNAIQLGKDNKNEDLNLHRSVHTIQKHMTILRRETKNLSVRGESRIYLTETDSNYVPLKDKVFDITSLFEDDIKLTSKSAEFHKQRILDFINK